MAEQTKKPLDLAHLPGGFYRQGDRVVDAHGNDLGDEAVEQADEIDRAAAEEGAKQKATEEEARALLATGGLAATLQNLLGAAKAPVAEPKKKPIKIDE